MMINGDRWAPKDGELAVRRGQMESLHDCVRADRLPTTWRRVIDRLTLAEWISFQRAKNALDETERMYDRLGVRA